MNRERARAAKVGSAFTPFNCEINIFVGKKARRSKGNLYLPIARRDGVELNFVPAAAVNERERVKKHNDKKCTGGLG